MIHVQKLSKRFGAMQAVHEISFSVERGEVLGFLGPNGAGKSTTMKMLTGFLTPSSGDATVCGHSILNEPLKAQLNIGYLPESAPSYSEMLVEEFLQFIGEVRGFSGKDLAKRIAYVLATTGLTEVQTQLIDTLSKGYRQRTCLAQALLHDPPVLVLDEPTDGLDPNQKHEVRNLIQRMSADRTILVSTHILEEVEAVCTRALIIASGKLVGYGTPDELLEKSEYHNAVTLSVRDANPDQMQEELERIDSVSRVEKILPESSAGLASVRVFPQSGRTITSEVQEYVSSRKLIPEQFYVERGRLDEVFRKLTQAAA
jgi:ABC-2 type transport system ATP-binding protein